MPTKADTHNKLKILTVDYKNFEFAILHHITCICSNEINYMLNLISHIISLIIEEYVTCMLSNCIHTAATKYNANLEPI